MQPKIIEVGWYPVDIQFNRGNVKIPSSRYRGGLKHYWKILTVICSWTKTLLSFIKKRTYLFSECSLTVFLSDAILRQSIDICVFYIKLRIWQAVLDEITFRWITQLHWLKMVLVKYRLWLVDLVSVWTYIH